MKNRLIALLVLFTVIFFSTAQAQTTARKFEAGKNTFLLDGKPFVVKAAELHYTRIPQAYWEHRIEMCKALGMNTICIYIFWNIHEQEEGKFDFSGQNDIAAFCRAAQKHGMYVIVRPGPYVCAEWEMGGLPWWLLKKKDIALRTLDPYYMERVGIFMKAVSYTHLDVYKRQAWVGAFLCPILFSGCVELLQEYCTTYRGGDWLDFAANTTGAVLASLVAYYVVRPRMKINKQ